MKPGRIIAAVLLTAIVVAAVAAWVLRPREPAYQGKSFTAWMADFDQNPGPTREKAAEALRQMRDDAICPLVAMLRSRDSRLKRIVIRLLRKQSLLNFQYTAPAVRHERALRAFFDLGPSAKGAVPPLTQLLTQPDSAPLAAQALAYIGGDAVMPVIEMLSHPDPRMRLAATASLWVCSREAGRVVPALVERLQDADAQVRGRAANSLAHIHQEPAIAIPALLRSLRDPHSYVRSQSAIALGAFEDEDEAKAAVPALLRASGDSDAEVRRAAAYSLERIEPGGAANADTK